MPPPPDPPPRGPTRTSRRPFPSPALNTYTLPGVHGTRRRWALEAGRNVGAAVAVLAPLVGLCVVTPLVALVAGVGGELRPGWPCLKAEAEVRERGGGGGGVFFFRSCARSRRAAASAAAPILSPHPPPPRRAPRPSSLTTTFGT